jgi:hypothetical protein
MDGFSSYNQINILPVDQHKTTFIFPWGTFAYQKLPFGLKNVGATFQRAMSYAFHDIKHMVKPYIDDLLMHSMHRQDHLAHLQGHFRTLSLLSHTFESTQMCFLCGIRWNSWFHCVYTWDLSRPFEG